MNNSREHSKLVDDLLEAFGSMPEVRVWLRPVGYDRINRVKYGSEGEADIQGIVRWSPTTKSYGRYLCIEAKTGTGRLSKEQQIYKDNMIRFGAIYIEARSVEQALADFYKQL